MLCRKFKNVLFTKSINRYVAYRPLVPIRSFSKWFDVFSGPNTTMSSAMRLKIVRDLILSRFLNGWMRNELIHSMVKRCRRERGMREVYLYFREVFFKPRKTHLLLATAAFNKSEDTPNVPEECSKNIRDKDMEKLISDLEGVEELSKATLYCEECAKRLVIDNKQAGVRYCVCANTKPTETSFEGWVPYMEAEDVVIWRKEYKPGGLYAYKIYGRYKHIRAEDFAMIQVDCVYRKVWDSAVASISVVERCVNGVLDQFVLHWEVLWPRLFANRDYVYVRRHKEYNIQTRRLKHKDGIFGGEPLIEARVDTQRPSVHTHAKRISQQHELEQARNSGELKLNKVYVIVSRSCVHPNVPETKNAIRVLEYWSHMVVTTLDGPDKPGMEFVLTYYDEPAVGGLPKAITTWAMGRAGPAFLSRMRSAAQDYRLWQTNREEQYEAPDFTPFETERVSDEIDDVNEEDMESSQQGPDLSTLETRDQNRDQATQTKPVIITPVEPCPNGPEVTIPTPCNLSDTIDTKAETTDFKMTTFSRRDNYEATVNRDSITKESDRSKMLDQKSEQDTTSKTVERDGDIEEEPEEKSTRWWRYLYPLYYFV